MSQYSRNHEAPVVYPPSAPEEMSYPSTPQSQGPYVAPPPVGYPMKNGGDYNPHQQPPHQPPVTQTKGGFWRGCCTGMCCCCLLDICF